MSKPAETPLSFATLVQAYSAKYLIQQRAPSPQIIAILLAHIGPALITPFLNHPEQQRHKCVRSRSARLAALRSSLKFAVRRDVSSLRIVERALAIPVKRFERPMFGYLSHKEMLAVIDAPDGTGIGQRDHLMNPTARSSATGLMTP